MLSIIGDDENHRKNGVERTDFNAEKKKIQGFLNMRQKREIVIEREETIAYTRRGQRFEAFCRECKSLVEMVTPQIAAVLTQRTEREIYRLVEKGLVHFVETDGVLICLNSLTVSCLEEKEL